MGRQTAEVYVSLQEHDFPFPQECKQAQAVWAFPLSKSYHP